MHSESGLFIFTFNSSEEGPELMLGCFCPNRCCLGRGPPLRGSIRKKSALTQACRDSLGFRIRSGLLWALWEALRLVWCAATRGSPACPGLSRGGQPCFSQLLDAGGSRAAACEGPSPAPWGPVLSSPLSWALWPKPSHSHLSTGSWAMKLSVTLTEPLHVLGILQSQEGGLGGQ